VLVYRTFLSFSYELYRLCSPEGTNTKDDECI